MCVCVCCRTLSCAVWNFRSLEIPLVFNPLGEKPAATQSRYPTYFKPPDFCGISTECCITTVVVVVFSLAAVGFLLCRSLRKAREAADYFFFFSSFFIRRTRQRAICATYKQGREGMKNACQIKGDRDRWCFGQGCNDLPSSLPCSLRWLPILALGEGMLHNVVSEYYHVA